MSSSNSDSIQVPSTSSAAGGRRHRRTSFWDIFSPARSHIIRSKRKSAGNGRRGLAIPAIRINSIDIGSSSAAFTGSLINLSTTGLDYSPDHGSGSIVCLRVPMAFLVVCSCHYNI